MEDMIVYMIVIMAVMFVTMLGYFKFNTYRWIGMKRRFSNKNLGIIMFRGHGRSVFPIVVNFDIDLFRLNGAVYIIEKSKIYRQVGDERSYKSEIDPKKMTFNQGCPIIFLDLNDIVPLGLENEENSAKIARSPQDIEAVLSKERAAMEAEALHNKSQDFKKIITLLYVTILISVIAMAAAAFCAVQIGQLGTLVSGDSNTLAVIKDLIVKALPGA